MSESKPKRGIPTLADIMNYEGPSKELERKVEIYWSVKAAYNPQKQTIEKNYATNNK